LNKLKRNNMTAVEWLISRQKHNQIFDIETIEKAKEIEKQQGVYSEEDMRKMYDISCGKIGLGEINDQTENDNRFKEFLEQVKK